MRYIVDWHIHSKYSRACSSALELPVIDEWCARKGIDVVATGDWTHPAWFAHIKEHLEEKRQGIYQLKRGGKREFMLVQEVSQIYSKGGKSRRVHNLIFSPSIETCEKVIKALKHRGFNLQADGRPILGIDSEDLYKLLKEIDEKIIVIPSHAWTPWYAIFGSKSGFDSIEECFGEEMSKYIYAIETGLSSDPVMNWRVSSLDNVVLISNSDAHSPRNLGREATVFEFEKPPTYDAFVRVLREKDARRLKYTIEFYPEEGKYFLDGCGECKFSCDPSESRRLHGRCPTCEKRLTLGVRHRIDELADREVTEILEAKIPYKSIVPLAEIIAEVVGVKSVQSKKVESEYFHLTNTLADEFTLLLDTPLMEIRQASTYPKLAQAIEQMRTGNVMIHEGYDGIFGSVKTLGI
ncbi:DNA helicase UvrD [Candidatus Uhrbacteria bacterium CG10_big_fil_rev_8_21_14_0_10_48_16]|uniref:DNA helicase UvrD n=1 Tax=Candidatus Uhrbacteria bacterium CG10_big_fil_rev_8_21_14_0_10_48_16 TaxID=1975038 RepID=A0A2M8LHP9_9BACT|nr:MAG: DNA helicase UvrD [Candidatus Uhrbacteria bacterium CG10_big_fil_rev_8_21_14_0_10_48_16]